MQTENSSLLKSLLFQRQEQYKEEAAIKKSPTSPRVKYLEALSQGPISATALTKQFKLHSDSTYKMLRRLEKEGYVVSNMHTAPRSYQLWSLTEAGEVKLKEYLNEAK